MMALDALISIEMEKIKNRIASGDDLQFNPSPDDGPQVGSFVYPKLEKGSDSKAYSPRAQKPHLNYSAQEKKEDPNYKYGSAPNVLNGKDPNKWTVRIHEDRYGWNYVLYYDGQPQGTRGSAKDKETATESARKLLKEAKSGGYVPPGSY